MLDVEKLQVGDVLENNYKCKCIITCIQFDHLQYNWYIDVIWQIGTVQRFDEDELKAYRLKETGINKKEFINNIMNFLQRKEN